jgi:hypothetical protein
LNCRLKPQSSLTFLARSDVDKQLGVGSDSSVAAAGDEGENGIVEGLIPNVGLNNKRRTNFASGLVAVGKVY